MKIRIKSDQCIGLLKAHSQHLKGHWRVIWSKQDLDVILRLTICTTFELGTLFHKTGLIEMTWS